MTEEEMELAMQKAMEDIIVFGEGRIMITFENDKLKVEHIGFRMNNDCCEVGE